MANYRKCMFCPTIVRNKFVCSGCKEKHDIIHNSGVFGGKGKKSDTPKLSAYTHELGSETQKLIDFVNKSGTIHYGRVVAQERLGAR